VTTWQTIAPVVNTYLDSDRVLSEPFNFGKGISIGRSEHWPVDPTIHQTIGEMYGLTIQRAQLCFVATYKARAMNEPDPNEPQRPIQNSALQRIRMANISAWLALPTALGSRVAIHQQELERGVYRWKGYETYLHPVPLQRYARNRHTEVSLRHARRLFARLEPLPRDSTVWNACRTLFKGLTEADPALRLPMIWFAIEGLLGADDGREVGFRLRQRAALLLGESRDHAREIAKTVKRGYVARSKIVHGMRISGDEDWEQILVDAEGVIRGLLLKILQRQQLVRVFNSKKRDAFLDDLAFRSKRVGQPT
jgi:hypothetical protein